MEIISIGNMSFKNKLFFFFFRIWLVEKDFLDLVGFMSNNPNSGKIALPIKDGSLISTAFISPWKE